MSESKEEVLTFKILTGDTVVVINWSIVRLTEDAVDSNW